MLDKKLANEGFMKRAPADKIAEAREQHAAKTKRLALLEEAKKLAEEL